MSHSWKSSIFSIENLLSDGGKSPNSNCSSPTDRQPAKRPKFSDDESSPTPEMYHNINNNNLRMSSQNYIYASPLNMQGNIVYTRPISLNQIHPMSAYYMGPGGVFYDMSGRKRKTRTVFTQDQTTRLESCFTHHKYLCLADRLALARELNLNEAQIKTWFQNRRTKLKKQLADTDEIFF